MVKKGFIIMINNYIMYSKKARLLINGILMLITLTLTTLNCNTVNADHFSPVWGDQNPQQWMNVVVTNANIDGVSVSIDDEIAVFDIDESTGDEICVGVTVLNSGTGPYFINAGKDAGFGGFTEGNAIIFRLWDASTSKEIMLMDVTFDLTPPLIDVYATNGLASAAIDSYSFNTWFGTVDGNWNNASNWDTGLIPSADNDVYIPSIGVDNFPELTATSIGECNNLTLEATANDRASILGNQYLTVNGISKVQSYISADQWHIISSPIGGINAGFFSLGGDPKVYLTEYDEEQEVYNYLTDPSGLLNNMQGYMLWVCDADNTYEYAGAMNSGTYGTTDNLVRNTSGSGNEGWNMVGNPYPSSIDWDAAAGWTRSANLGSAIYTYNNGVWEYYLDDSPSGHSENGTKYIAPGQGFFMRVLNGTSGTIIMDDDVRVHNNTDFLKSRETSSYVKLLVEGKGKQDETIVRFKEGATNNFDGQFDVFKKFLQIEDHPQIYSHTDEHYYINSVASTDHIPISFISGTAGEYTISIKEIEDIGNIWIEDLVTGTYFDITSGDYTFDYQQNENPERFVLHFTPVSIHEQASNNINTYSDGNEVYIISNESIGAVVTIYNMLGKKVLSSKINGLSKKLAISQMGYYIVSIQTEHSTINSKIFIR